MTLRQENFILHERFALYIKSGYYPITQLYIILILIVPLLQVIA